MKIEFLQMLSRDGVPIFSKCFGKICGTFLENDVLLHQYLTSIKDIIDDSSSSFSDNVPQGVKKEIRRLKSGIVIVFGISDFTNEKDLSKNVDDMIKDINHTISLKWIDQSWQKLDENRARQFEENFLVEAILPWFERFHDSDSCSKAENCIFRKSMLSSISSVDISKDDDTIWQRMNDVYHDTRKRDEELLKG